MGTAFNLDARHLPERHPLPHPTHVRSCNPPHGRGQAGDRSDLMENMPLRRVGLQEYLRQGTQEALWRVPHCDGSFPTISAWMRWRKEVLQC